MASVLIVYGSTTGNTAYTAEVLDRVVSGFGNSSTVLDATHASADGLCEKYGAVLFGCSMWGDEEIEMQDDFIPLFNSLENAGVKGKKTAVFGCGDSSYTYFCGAVDMIEKRLEELGAELVTDGLKIDGEPHTAKEEIEDWGKEVIKSL